MNNIKFNENITSLNIVSQTQYNKNRIDVLETADVKSSDTFLNTVQNSVNKKK